MKVNRQQLLSYIKRIKSKNPDVSDEELADSLANYIEVNPSCIELQAVSHPGRFSFSTVGYGVFSLMGEKYRMGRVEIFDRQEDSGYPIDEGSYCMPFIAANQFEDFIASLETDLPIEIKIGSYEFCKEECAKELGFKNGEEMLDKDKAKQYRKDKNDAYAREKGYKDFEEMTASIFDKYSTNKNKE